MKPELEKTDDNSAQTNTGTSPQTHTETSIQPDNNTSIQIVTETPVDTDAGTSEFFEPKNSLFLEPLLTVREKLFSRDFYRNRPALIQPLPGVSLYNQMPRRRYFNFIRMPAREAIWPKSLTYSINSFLFAAQIAANAKMLSQVSDDGDAAGAIVSTFQNLTVGAAVSCMLSAGIHMGMSDHMTEARLKQTGNMVKSSWALTGILGTLNLIIQLTSPLTFPYLYQEKPAKVASDFFLGYAVGSIPGLFMTTNLQVAFHTNDLDVSTFTVLLSTIPGVFLSYALAFPGGLGALGLGIGATAPNFLAAGFIHYWFSKRRYTEFEFYKLTDLQNNCTLPLKDLEKNLITLFKTGYRLVLQRLTEWGNLFTIAIVLNKSAPSSVIAAIGPAIQYSGIVAFALQGLAHATAMTIQRDMNALNQTLNTTNIDHKGNHIKIIEENCRYYQNKIRYTLRNNNISGIIAATVISVPFYVFSEPLCNFFLSDDADDETKELASTLLWISMLGLIPDASRIIDLGALRSWKQVFLPTFMCLLVMTAIGVPAGYGISKSEDDWSYMMIIRDLAMFVSALILRKMCATQINENNEGISRAIASIQEKEMVSLAPPHTSITNNVSLCPALANSTTTTNQAIFDTEEREEKEQHITMEHN